MVSAVCCAYSPDNNMVMLFQKFGRTRATDVLAVCFDRAVGMSHNLQPEHLVHPTAVLWRSRIHDLRRHVGVVLQQRVLVTRKPLYVLAAATEHFELPLGNLAGRFEGS